MSNDDIDDTGDLIIGLNRIAEVVGVSGEAVRNMWKQGRVPVTRFGQFWLANRSALAKAMEHETIRRRRGPKTEAEKAEIEAARELVRLHGMGGKPRAARPK